MYSVGSEVINILLLIAAGKINDIYRHYFIKKSKHGRECGKKIIKLINACSHEIYFLGNIGELIVGLLALLTLTLFNCVSESGGEGGEVIKRR